MLRGPRIVVLVACLFCLATPTAAQKLYKYVDSNGKTIYTDKPPIEATGRASEQLNTQGTVIQRTKAAPTAEERAALAETRKRKIEDDIRTKEEKRKNEALLNTYSSETDIDEARERALKGNEEAIKDAERKLADAQKRQQQLKAESEFYQKKPMPAQLKRDVQANETELKAHSALLEAKRKETDAITTKYVEDKRRYQELSASRGSMRTTSSAVR
jgi:Domain of unknown function (DUF4124)